VKIESLSPRRVASALSRHRLACELVLAPLALIAIFLKACGHLLGGDKSVATWMDNTNFYLPLFNHISRSFAGGEHPYWINTLVCGVPLYNNPQFSLLYPFYFFHSGLYQNAQDAILQLHYVTFFHILVTYFNCYVMLRVLRLSPVPSVLGASVYTFSATTFLITQWISIIAPYSWFPLVIAGVFLILEDKYRRTGVLLGTASLSLLVLACPAHPLIYASYTIGVLYVFNAVRRLRSGERGRLLSATKNLLLTGALTFLICSPVLLPVVLDNRGMIRFNGNDPPTVGYERMTFDAMLVGQLEISNLAGALLPLQVQSSVGSPFVGIAAGLLALLAIFKARSNWIIAPLFFISLYALLSSAGSHLGLAYINYRLPLINKVREPARHLFLFVLGFSVLAAFGFSYLTDTLGRRYRELLSPKHLMLLLLFLCLLLLSWNASLPYVGSVSKWRLLALYGLSCALLFTIPLLKGRAVVSKVASLLAASLIIYANLQYPWTAPTLQEGDYFEPANLVSHRTLEEIGKLPGVRDYRIVFPIPGPNELREWSMNGSYYGLRSFRAYMNPLPFRQFYEVFFPQLYSSRYALLLGGKYYLCSECEAERLSDYHLEREINGYKLYVSDSALPRYALLSRVAGVMEAQELFFKRLDEGFDFRNEAYVSAADDARLRSWLGAQTVPASYRITEEYASLNRVRLRVESSERALFVLNEYYNTNWKASVDGARAETFKINLNQVGVMLDKGSHTVEFEYRPTLYIWLLRLQLVVLFVLALYLYLAPQA
jgi:hypothetical protein